MICGCRDKTVGRKLLFDGPRLRENGIALDLISPTYQVRQWDTIPSGSHVSECCIKELRRRNPLSMMFDSNIEHAGLLLKEATLRLASVYWVLLFPGRSMASVHSSS